MELPAPIEMHSDFLSPDGNSLVELAEDRMAVAKGVGPFLVEAEFLGGIVQLEDVPVGGEVIEGAQGRGGGFRQKPGRTAEGASVEEPRGAAGDIPMDAGDRNDASQGGAGKGR